MITGSQIVIIVGSAAKEGHTKKVADRLAQEAGWDILSLKDFDISHYDYEHANRHDDYLKLMTQIIEKYDTWVLATPVYWYAMSGIMKVFFDRLTDLLTIEKGIGRKLRGKKMAAVSCSNGDNLGDYFWLPFSKTANYLGMDYLCSMHTISGKPESDGLADFIRCVETGTHC